MTELGISLGVSPREPIDRFVSLLQAAERSGVDAAWIVDSQLAMKDAYIVLALAARETEHIAVGPGVTNVITRHETVVANAMATLATFAPSRVLLGLGAGDSAVYPLGRSPLSIRACREAVCNVRDLIRGGSIEGPCGELRLSFTPDPPPPVFLAASQPRMLRLAGAVADGVIVMGPADPEVVAMQLAAVDEGARTAGRDPKTVQRDLWVTMAVGEGSTEDVKSWASAQARWLTKWKHVPDSLERFRPELVRAAEEYDFATHLSRHAHHASTISDELARALAVAGNLDECAQRIRTLAASGVERITLSLLSGGREHHLEQILDVWSRR